MGNKGIHITSKSTSRTKLFHKFFKYVLVVYSVQQFDLKVVLPNIRKTKFI